MIQIAVSDDISNLHVALIKTFLETFEVQEKGKRRSERKYMNMIKEVRQLKRKVIPVSLDELENSQQSRIAQNVKINTVRYVELFEDVIDELLSTIPYTEEPTNPTDILNVVIHLCFHCSVIVKSERSLKRGK